MFINDKTVCHAMHTAVILFSLIFSQVAFAEPVMIESDWLAQHVDDKGLLIVDMSSDPLQYTRFHIPGAVRLSYDELQRVRKPDSVKLRISNPQFYTLLGKLGISRKTYVVIYDDMGGLNAGRMFWQLEQIGHPRASVLNGGLVSWIQEGHKVTGQATEPSVATYQPVQEFRDNEIAYSAVREQIKTNQSVFIDVRSREEYQGSPRLSRSGHIPGALWWPWENSIDTDNAFRHKPLKELQAQLIQIGVSPKKPVIVYCRTGHRASQSYLTLRALGYTRVQLYDGSMAEYSQHRDAPLMKSGSH
ncbi:MAG TPA: sulfurtransferase [Gammaproteobacteria bacterium]|nr:sulfurtransferase [Gammaproteobacteria bacterium]